MVVVIGMKMDARAAFRLAKGDRGAEKLRTDTLVTVAGVDDDIVEDCNSRAERGADGKEQIHQAYCLAVVAVDENTAYLRIVDDTLDAFGLERGVGVKVVFLREEMSKQLDELR